jgi:hypothetical protein
MLLCSEDYAVEQYTAGSEGGATRQCGVRGAIRQQQGMYRPVACHALHNMSQRAARRAPNNRLTVRRMNLIDVRAQRCCAPTDLLLRQGILNMLTGYQSVLRPLLSNGH